MRGAEPFPESEEKVHDDDDDDEPAPPPTPAVQFYSTTTRGPAGNPTGQTNSNSARPIQSNPSSSSSLASMAAALVSGGPLVLQQLRQQPKQYTGTESGVHDDGESPISPAAMIGGEYQENLLLPPVSRGQAADRSSVHPPLEQERQQQHMAWLRNINAMASAVTAGYRPNVAPGGGQTSGATTAFPAPHPAVFGNHPLLFAQAATLQDKPPPVESEEKRAKRLERNRESARKSRRKKRERLSALEEQVNKLTGKIEVERRNHVNTMVDRLARCRLREVDGLVAANDGADISDIVTGSGPSSAIARTVVDFQYTHLKRYVLPEYQKLLLWSSMQPDHFLLAGKEEFAQRDNKRQPVRGMATKFSSKQIGEEILNKARKDRARRGESSQNLDSQTTVHAHESKKFWPLFCYELKVSVDQEDQLVSAHKRVRAAKGMESRRDRLIAAVEATEHLQEATATISHAISQREGKTLLGVLRPKQVAAFLAWRDRNKHAPRNLYTAQAKTGHMSESQETEASLLEICRRLQEVVQVSRGSPD